MSSAAIPGPLLESLVGTYGPRRIVLFGSHARGEARSGSDLDILVLLDDDAPAEMLGWRRRHEARRGFTDPVDILPCRAGVFAARARPGVARRRHRARGRRCP
jgi:uncharacterized protein